MRFRGEEAEDDDGDGDGEAGVLGFALGGLDRGLDVVTIVVFADDDDVDEIVAEDVLEEVTVSETVTVEVCRESRGLRRSGVGSGELNMKSLRWRRPSKVAVAGDPVPRAS